MTIQEIKRAMEEQPTYWQIPLMDFVDEFRRTKNAEIIQKPFQAGNEQFDALVASTIEYVCDEQGVEAPVWVWAVPACQQPWFVSGVENLKATALVESPVYFRRCKIFVLGNFLDRM